MNLFSKKYFLLCLSMLVALTFNAVAQTSQTLESIKTKIQNKQQITNLPTVYLTVPDAIGKDINSVLVKTGNVAEYHKATIQLVDNSAKDCETHVDPFIDEVEIKVRGNSTAGDSKRPYRLKFGKDKKDAAGNVVASHKHDMLNCGYSKRNWTLLTNHKDKSLLHNAMTYYVGQAVGMPFCPGYKFVDLVINGEYRGNYQISDHCEVGSHRVDVDEDTGWFIEAARGDMVEEPVVEAAGLRMSIKNPEPSTDAETAALKAEVKDYFTRLNHFWGIYSTPCSDEEFQNAQTGWRVYIDEESLVNFYVGINLTDDYDGFMTVKMYREVDGKLMFGPLWDKDLAYGNWGNHGKLCEKYQPAYTFCDHIERMMTDPYFVKKVHDKLHAVLDAGFVKKMQSMIQSTGTLITESQKLNQQKWWTCSDYPAAIKEFSSYVEEHAKYVVSEIDKKYVAMGGDNIPDEAPGSGGELGGSGDSNANKPENDKPFDSGMTFGDWAMHQVPASCFLSTATSATITVKGAVYVLISTSTNSNDESAALKKFSWSDNNKPGVSYTLEGANLELAKQGKIYVGCNDGEGVSLTVTNHGATSTDPGDDTDPKPGETPKPDEPSETFPQLSQLPSVYLTIYDATTDTPYEEAQKKNTVDLSSASTSYNQARIVIVDGTKSLKERDEEVGIRVRGNSTIGSGYGKYPYRLKFPAKTKLLSDGNGVNNYANAKSWTLMANKGDYSLIRNALSAELGKYLGMPFVPAYKFVDLYVNGQYRGIYQISDQVQVHKSRVNVNEDTGWFLSIEERDSYCEDPWFSTESTYFNIKNPETTVVSSGQTEDPQYSVIKAYMTSMLKTFSMPGNASSNWKSYLDGQALAEYVDMESLVNYLIGIEITGDPDGAVDNFYCYKEAENDKLHFGPMWDYDLAYGNVSHRDQKEAHFFGDATWGWAYKVKQLYTDATFMTALWTRWQQVYDEGALTTYLLQKVDELDLLVQKSQNKTKAPEHAGSVAGSNTYSSQSEAIKALKSWIPGHIVWLNKTFATEYKAATGLDPYATCKQHSYTKAEYAVQDDKTYRRKCDVCGTAETSGDVYYQYTIYKESKETDVVYSTSKTYLADNAATYKNLPNALAVVEADGLTGTNVVSNGKCSKVVIVDGHPFYNPKKFTAQEAEYTRKVTNTWGTVCLPFKVLATDEVKYYVLQDVTADGDEGLMCFVEAESTGGQNPMAFRKLDTSATTVTFTSGKPIDGVTVKKTREIGNVDTSSEPCNGWRMLGNVDQEVVLSAADDAGMYYISGNKFWHATSTLTVAPFRAYFSTASTSQAARFRISSLDADGIEQIWCDQEMTVPVMTDIMGRTVRPDLQHSPGIYVVNGQKVMLR